MNFFLKNMLLFFSINICLLFIIIACNLVVSKHCLKSLYLNSDITTLVMGDSHTEAAINDKLSQNMVNLSKNSEHYFFTFNKLKAITQYNHHIKTVILGCSYHSLPLSDSYVLDKEAARYLYPAQFLALDLESKIFLIRNNLAGVVFSFIGIMKYGVSSLLRYNSTKMFFRGAGKNILEFLFYRNDNFDYWGGFYNSTKSNINDDTVAISIKRHFFNNDETLQNFSYLQDYYLNRIILYCVENKIRICLLNTPVSERYYTQIPDKFITHYYSVMNKYKNINNLFVLDYHAYQLPGECFGDGDHLNKRGADKFTLFLNRSL